MTSCSVCVTADKDDDTQRMETQQFETRSELQSVTFRINRLQTTSHNQQKLRGRKKNQAAHVEFERFSFAYLFILFVQNGNNCSDGAI